MTRPGGVPAAGKIGNIGKGPYNEKESAEEKTFGGIKVKKLLFVVGSLRHESLNRQCAEFLAQDLQEKMKITFLEYADIPYMNEDIEFPTPAPIARVRAEILETDGIWFVTPEYNASYPGVLKNLIDWLSRATTPDGPRKSAVIWGKKCAVTSVGGGAHGAHCIANMEKLVPFVGGKLLSKTLGIGYTREELTQSRLQFTPERVTKLRLQEEAFLKFLD